MVEAATWNNNWRRINPYLGDQTPLLQFPPPQQSVGRRAGVGVGASVGVGAGVGAGVGVGAGQRSAEEYSLRATMEV